MSTPTFLFGDHRIVTASRGNSEFSHTFGGPPERDGASREDSGGILIHLLHRLNLNDPLIPVSLPGLNWLPLYYCFDFRANDLGYRLLSDDRLVTFFPDDDPNVSDHESWPGENFPLEFPRCEIRLSQFRYDPTDPHDAYAWAGVFGIGQLSPKNQQAVRQRVLDEFDEFDAPPVTDEEFESALSYPFIQGKPVGGCLNPECNRFGRKGGLAPFALIHSEPVPGVQIFGHWGDGVELIFQVCPDCHSIRVTNQST